MRVLLLSMPDSFEHTPSLTMRMPNGALASLAGNVDRHHQVSIADLILAQGTVRQTVERLVRDLDPEVVGLSVMTFQRRTALGIVRLIRQMKPEVQVVAGGYDPSLAPAAYEGPDSGIDFLVRGEGDLTFRELLRALEGPHSRSVAGDRFGEGQARLPHRTASAKQALRFRVFRSEATTASVTDRLAT